MNSHYIELEQTHYRFATSLPRILEKLENSGKSTKQTIRTIHFTIRVYLHSQA